MSLWERLEAVLGGGREPSLRRVPGQTSELPSEDDARVESPTGATHSVVEGVSVGIDYVDSRGQPSTRTIRCQTAFSVGATTYLHAWCLDRQDWRTFRVDHIRRVLDYTTGEERGTGPAFFGALLGREIDEPEHDAGAEIATPAKEPTSDGASDEKPANPISDADAAGYFADGVRVLLFIAMSDDEIHPKELDAIVRFGARRIRKFQPRFDDPERAARAFAGNYVPSRQAALASLHDIALNQAYAEEIAEAVKEVIQADGTVTDGELEAAWTIEDGLSQERAKWAEARQSRERATS